MLRIRDGSQQAVRCPLPVKWKLIQAWLPLDRLIAHIRTSSSQRIKRVGFQSTVSPDPVALRSTVSALKICRTGSLVLRFIGCSCNPTRSAVCIRLKNCRAEGDSSRQNCRRRTNTLYCLAEGVQMALSASEATGATPVLESYAYCTELADYTAWNRFQ